MRMARQYLRSQPQRGASGPTHSALSSFRVHASAASSWENTTNYYLARESGELIAQRVQWSHPEVVRVHELTALADERLLVVVLHEQRRG